MQVQLQIQAVAPVLKRRRIIGIGLARTALVLGAPWVISPARAQGGLAALSERDAASGLRTLLERGAVAAVQLLGKADGFWGNDRVRIPLPRWLEQGERALRLVGRGADVDALKLGVNRAAEQAVPEAKTLLVNAVKTMSVQDAKGIIGGGDDAVTRFFETRTREPLSGRFLPIVAKITDRIGLARQYNALADRGRQLGLVDESQARIERHVTTRALDGLFLMIGEEEKKIRTDPVGTGSAILKKVFGSLR